VDQIGNYFSPLWTKPEIIFLLYGSNLKLFFFSMDET